MTKSNFDGYVGVSKDGKTKIGKTSREDRARGMKEAYDRDYEGMRTNHETYRKKDDPNSKETSRRLGKADEKTADSVQRANQAYDDEKRREYHRGAAEGKNKLTVEDKKY